MTERARLRQAAHRGKYGCNWLTDGQGPELGRRTDASPKCPTPHHTVARRYYRPLDKQNVATGPAEPIEEHRLNRRRSGLAGNWSRAIATRRSLPTSGQAHLRCLCRYCRCSTPDTGRRLSSSRPPHSRSPSAPRQSAPMSQIDRPQQATRHSSVQPPTRHSDEENSCSQPQPGWSIQMPRSPSGKPMEAHPGETMEAYRGETMEEHRLNRRRSGLAGNWSRAIATRRSLPTSGQAHLRCLCRYCRCSTPDTGRRLSSSRPPHSRSPSAPRQSAPMSQIDRPQQATRHSSVQPPTRHSDEENSCSQPQPGWSIQMPRSPSGKPMEAHPGETMEAYRGETMEEHRLNRRRSGLAGNWSRAIATRRSLPTSGQAHLRCLCRYCRCSTPDTGRRLSSSRPPHSRSPSAPRQSAPMSQIDRPQQATRHSSVQPPTRHSDKENS